MTKYDVCLSFAGEDRTYVHEVAQHLKALKVRVFYDNDEQVDLWGKNLTEYLDEIYRKQSRFCVMFVSRHYARKMWTKHERQSAFDRALTQDHEYVLPARFDETEVPGLRTGVGYLDLTRLTPRQLAEMIAKKLGTPVPAQAAGWEYELFADTLRQALKNLQGKRRDHDMEWATRTRTLTSEREALDHFLAATSEFDEIVNSIESVLAPERQEWAFGAPGESGDAENIRHLATRFAGVYERLLDWAADLRGTGAPEKHRNLYQATARLVDGPLTQIEEFVEQFAASVTQQQPVELRLTIGYDEAEVTAELAKVQTT